LALAGPTAASGYFP